MSDYSACENVSIFIVMHYVNELILKIIVQLVLAFCVMYIDCY